MKPPDKCGVVLFGDVTLCGKPPIFSHLPAPVSGEKNTSSSDRFPLNPTGENNKYY